MANVKISGLPAVTSVATTDVIPVVTGGVTSKIGSANFVNSGLSGGTANGVLYLNGSKAATSGSALTFDGTNLGIGTSSPAVKLDIVGRIQSKNSASDSGGLQLYSDVSGDAWLIEYYNRSMIFGTGNAEKMRLSSDGTFRVKGDGTAGSTDAVQFSGSAPASSMSLDSYGNLHVPGGGGISTNEAFGKGALRSNTTGNYNTASGTYALYSNTTGSNNTASGLSALYYNTTGNQNTASGLNALYNNTTGSYNTASGTNALFNSGKTVTAGSFVVGVSYTIQSIGTTDFTLIGAASNTVGLTFTTTGVGTGTGTASSNTHNNSAFGYQALYSNTTGSYNTASGYQALLSNTTGNKNTASGYAALYNNTTGNYNTASGLNALYNNATGSGNTALNPVNSAGTYAPVFDPTTENNRFCMGSTGVTNAYIQVAWTVVSDLRDKLLLGDVPHGLDFVTKLKPIKYQFKESRDSDIGHGPIKYGFGAQDVLALEGDDAVIVDTEVEDKLKITDSHLVPVLVKAIQELKAELDELKSQLGK